MSTYYESLNEGWWQSYIKGLGDYHNHEVAAHKLIQTFIEALGVPDGRWRYVKSDGTHAPRTSYSFVAATEPQKDGWATTCFSITFEMSHETFPKQNVTVRLWMRAAENGWDIRLYEGDTSKHVNQDGEPLAPIVAQFVDEMKFVLCAITAWPPPSEHRPRLGFHVDPVERGGA